MKKLFICLLLLFCVFDSFPSTGEAREETIEPNEKVPLSFISRVSEEYLYPDGFLRIKCWKSKPILEDNPMPIEMKYMISIGSIFGGFRDVGSITLSFHGKGGCYKTQDHQIISEPVLRLKFITILEQERKSGYAKQALGALFMGLKKSPLLSGDLQIGLEYDVDKPFLGNFYGKYGFQHVPDLSFSGYANPSLYNVMMTPLRDIVLA